eukprot:PhM_4_TR13677/c5_g1_i4/m.19435
MDGDAWSSHSTCDDTDAERPSCEAVRALPLKAALPEDAVWTIVRRGGAEERASCTNHAHTPSFAAHTAGGGTPSSRRAATAPHAASATMARRPVCTTLSRAATSAHCASHMLDTCGVIGAVAFVECACVPHSDGLGDANIGLLRALKDELTSVVMQSGDGEGPPGCRTQRVDVAVKCAGRCLGVAGPCCCCWGAVFLSSTRTLFVRLEANCCGDGANSPTKSSMPFGGVCCIAAGRSSVKTSPSLLDIDPATLLSASVDTTGKMTVVVASIALVVGGTARSSKELQVTPKGLVAAVGASLGGDAITSLFVVLVLLLLGKGEVDETAVLNIGEKTVFVWS